jgi:hypothetical protein
MNAATTAVTASPRERTAALRALALALGLTLVAAALSVPPLRSLIERSMVWHMVVQMPLLMLAGWLCAGAWSQKDIKSNSESTNESANQSPTTWNQFGLTGGLMALVALKLTSLWMCGALLRQSAVRAPLVLQLFFVGTALPMLMWAGLYFASTDLRLCNAYSLDSQIAAGRSLAALGAALGAWWTVRTAVRLRHVA